MRFDLSSEVPNRGAGSERGAADCSFTRSTAPPRWSASTEPEQGHDEPPCRSEPRYWRLAYVERRG